MTLSYQNMRLTRLGGIAETWGQRGEGRRGIRSGQSFIWIWPPGACLAPPSYVDCTFRYS